MAYGRIVVYRFKPGTVDEVIRKAKVGMLPIFRAQPGFRRYVAVKTGDAAGATMSSWDSKAEADAAVKAAAEWVKQNVAADIIGVENHVGEIAFNEAN